MGERILSVRGGPLRGIIGVPGDKSVSHRALMIGALAVGETRISGLLEGEDVLATASAMRGLGAEISAPGPGGGAWTVAGRGVGGLREPDDILDFGNAGTGARLSLGLLAGHPVTATLTGDASLRSRPMARVMDPLKRMGAAFTARNGGRLPLTITGTDMIRPADEELAVASAQVKSAILLAGLSARGWTLVREPAPSRDHTEIMLRQFGASIEVETLPGGGRVIRLEGQPELAATDVTVPGDISSAAFPMIAALIVEGSGITLPGVGVNPLRTGLVETLMEMGADIAVQPTGGGGEPMAGLSVSASELTAVTVPAERAPRMIDEYPILSVAAALAKGSSRFEGVGELRVKESDRFTGLLEGLTAAGVRVEAEGDDLIIHGTGGPPKGGVTLDARLDHRMGMAFAVLGLVTREPVVVTGTETIDTSFPGFVGLMAGAGAHMAADPAP